MLVRLQKPNYFIQIQRITCRIKTWACNDPSKLILLDWWSQKTISGFLQGSGCKSIMSTAMRYSKIIKTDFKDWYKKQDQQLSNRKPQILFWNFIWKYHLENRQTDRETERLLEAPNRRSLIDSVELDIIDKPSRQSKSKSKADDSVFIKIAMSNNLLPHPLERFKEAK